MIRITNFIMNNANITILYHSLPHYRNAGISLKDHTHHFQNPCSSNAGINNNLTAGGGCGSHC